MIRAILYSVLFGGNLVLSSVAEETPRPNVPRGGSNWEPVEGAARPTIQDLRSLNAEDLVEELVGDASVIIESVSFEGAAIAGGVFRGGHAAVGLDRGLVLSTGNVASIAGPNRLDGVTTENLTPGDADLDELLGASTQDAASLSFEFSCAVGGLLQLRFVFASDEYNEFVGGVYGDGMGIFVDGENIARVGARPFVGLNSVNCGDPFNPPDGGVNCECFRNNDLEDGGGALNTEMDGLTEILTAEALLDPGTHSLKIAIADVGDGLIDSNVLVQTAFFPCGVECFLLVGARRANEPFGNDDLLLLKIKEPAEAWTFPVLETSVPVFRVPGRPGIVGRRMFMQVYMNNPSVFPSDPVQMSNGLEVTLGSEAIPAMYGPHSGIRLWAEAPALPGGDFTIRFDVLGM